jgi:hypothetical protein
LKLLQSRRDHLGGICFLGETEDIRRNEESREADSSLTTPKLKSVWGPVRSE